MTNQWAHRFVSSYFQHYTGATGFEMGTIQLIGSLLSIPYTLTISTMADRHQSHRFIYLITLMIYLLAYSALLIPAFYKSKSNEQHVTNYSYSDRQDFDKIMNNNSNKFEYSVVKLSNDNIEIKEDHSKLWYYFISMCLIIINLSTRSNMSMSNAFAANLAAKLKIPYGSIRLWGSFGIITSTIILIVINKVELVGFMVPSLIVHTVVGFAHWFVVAVWPNKKPFELTDKTISTSIDYFNCDTTGCASFNYNEKFLFRRGITKDYSRNFEMVFQEFGQDNNNNSSTHDARPLLANFNKFEFDSQESSLSSSTSTSSELSNHNKCLIEAHKFDDEVNKKVKAIKFTIYLRVIMMIIAKNKHLLRFIFIFILCGFITQGNWVYFLPYIKSIYQDDFLKVSSYLLFGRNISEMLFYFASPIVSRNVNHSMMLTIAMIGFAIRCSCFILYKQKILLIYIVIIEILCAPFSAIFYCAMNEIAIKFSLKSVDCVSELIEKSLINNDQETISRINNGFKATMVALSSRCFDSIGFAIGSIACGWIVDSKGYITLWIVCASIAGFSALFNILFELRNYTTAKNETTKTLSEYKISSNSDDSILFNITEHLSESDSLDDKGDEELNRSQTDINKV